MFSAVMMGVSGDAYIQGRKGKGEGLEWDRKGRGWRKGIGKEGGGVGIGMEYRNWKSAYCGDVFVCPYPKFFETLLHKCRLLIL